MPGDYNMHITGTWTSTDNTYWTNTDWYVRPGRVVPVDGGIFSPEQLAALERIEEFSRPGTSRESRRRAVKKAAAVKPVPLKELTDALEKSGPERIAEFV